VARRRSQGQRKRLKKGKKNTGKESSYVSAHHRSRLKETGKRSSKKKRLASASNQANAGAVLENTGGICRVARSPI